MTHCFSISFELPQSSMDLSMIIKTSQTKKNTLYFSQNEENDLAVTNKGHSKIRACCDRDGNSVSAIC